MVRPRGAWTAATALSLAVWLAASPSGAQQTSEDVEVTYAASAQTCPAEGDFLAMVRRHTTKWSVAAAGAGARRFDVRLAPREGVVAGTLVVIAPDGNTKTREIDGPECGAVAEAVAIVMALAIDPDASLEAIPSAESHEHDVPAEPAREEPPPRAAPPRSKAIPPPPPPRKEKLALTFAVSAGAELTSAVVRDPLVVFGAAFDARVCLGDRVPSWLAPSLALGLRQSLPEHLSGNSEFVWTAATIRICPVRLAALDGRVSFRPCGETDIGVLRAETHGIPNARSESSGWLDLAGSLRSAFAINRTWSAGASFSVVASQTRERYALATGELISQAPAVGVAGGLFLELDL